MFFLVVSALVISLLSLFGIVFYIYLFGRLYATYFKDLVTALIFPGAVTAILFTSSVLQDCACPEKWQWQLGTFAVFLGWINFCVLFRKLPLIGKYTISMLLSMQ